MFYNESDTLEEVRRCLPGQESCCFTGHRPAKLPWGYNESDPRCVRLKERIADAVLLAYQEGTGIFSAAWPRAATSISVRRCWPCGSVIRRSLWRPPFPVPPRRTPGPEAERRRYRELVAKCDMETMVSDTYSSACMQRRDRYMVDHAMLLIAAFDGTAGGTRYTVEYALRRGIEIFDVSIPVK